MYNKFDDRYITGDTSQTVECKEILLASALMAAAWQSKREKNDEKI